jgi:small-conductance mechanosensitive channel
MDLSSIPQAVRAVEAPLLAAYLKQTLDRVGYVIYQEVPDDPDRPLPYVHFRHPRGDIVLVRSVVDSVPGWRFSDRTMSGIRDLYEALEDVPLASRLIPDQRSLTYFGLNQFVRRHTPALTRLWMGLELWQWLAIALSLSGAVLAAFGFDLVLRRLLHARLHRHKALAGHRLRTRMLLPLAVALALVVGYLCVISLGLPLKLFPLLHSVALGTMVAAVAWTVYVAIGVAQDVLRQRAEHSQGFGDDLLISLLGSLARIAVVVLGLVLLARELGVPLGGIIAGLGVAGVAVAMAAKDTVANLFGAAALLADRPFRRGDHVSIAGHEGQVHEVGLRSTQIRTAAGAMVSIPNSLMANTSIENRGRPGRGGGPPGPG